MYEHVGDELQDICMYTYISMGYTMRIHMYIYINIYVEIRFGCL